MTRSNIKLLMFVIAGGVFYHFVISFSRIASIHKKLHRGEYVDNSDSTAQQIQQYSQAGHEQADNERKPWRKEEHQRKVYMLEYPDSDFKSAKKKNKLFEFVREVHNQTDTQSKEKKYKVYTAFVGRIGNHIHNFVGTYGLARTNNRQLVIQPEFIRYLSKFLNVSYWDKFPIEKAPKEVPLKWFKYATYQPEMEHLEERDLILGNNVQAIQYFQPYLAEIKELLHIRTDFVRKGQTYLKWIDHGQATTFVGIHIRRGDFLSDLEVDHGRKIPKPRYLQKAMLYFLERYKNVHFVVCSDEIEWCKKHEVFLQPQELTADITYSVDFSEGHTAEIDLAILTQCNHTILTVGTFGWWAGWFAGGEVIYFNKPNVNGSMVDEDFTAKDYFWPTWIGLDDEE